MKNLFWSMIAFGLLTSAAQAACYADYKAKQDDPLRLHYGVASVSGDCSVANAQAQLAVRLQADGWQLLTVLSVFDDASLDQKQETAGEYYLRY